MSDETQPWDKIWTNTSENTGWVKSVEQSDEVRKSFEVAKALAFVSGKKEANFGDPKFNSPKEIPQKARVRFHDLGHQHAVPTDGMPFLILGRGDRYCVFGKDKHKKKKERQKASKVKRLQSDHPAPNRVRKLLQSSKKKGCPAKIVMKDVLLFPEYKVERSSSERARRSMSEKLRDDIHERRENIKIDRRIHITLPSDEDHKNTHSIGELTGFMKPLSKEVKEKLQELVGHGVSSVSEMRRHLRVFVETILIKDQKKPSLSDAAYFPTDVIIRKHIYRAMLRLRYSKIDQENLLQKVADWQESYPKDNFNFMPAASSPTIKEEDEDLAGIESLEQDDEDEICPQMKTEATDFFICHQSQFQRRLLYRYGNSLCLLDATYRTTKYALPLFFLAVKTNVGLSVVGEFVVQHETKSSIIQGLNNIKKWMDEDPEKPENWEWQPKFFMTDFCEREIGAIEEVFAESFVFICDFHREQSWMRWESKVDNGVSDLKDKILGMLRRIAHACTESEYDSAVSALQSSDLWCGNRRLRNWFTKTWLSEKQRWVWAYRFGRGVLVNTNNGLERQNKLFKYTFLEQKKNSSLSAMVTTLVNDYLPTMMLKYIRDNATASDAVGRSYNTEVPVFLRNRPSVFIKHCLSKIELSESITDRDVECLSDTKYKVRSQMDIKGKSHYTVELGIPRCDCHAWSWTLLPCKHLFAVINLTSATWENLPESYRSSPYFCLDDSVINIPVSAPSTLNETIDEEEDDQVSQPPLENTITSELPLRKTTSKPLKVLAVGCREKLALIQNATYMCQNEDALHKLQHLLQEALQFVNDNLYVDAGLTVQPDTEVKTEEPAVKPDVKVKSRTQSLRERLKKKKRRKTAENKEPVVIVDGEADIPCPLLEDAEEMLKIMPTMEREEMVKEAIASTGKVTDTIARRALAALDQVSPGKDHVDTLRALVERCHLNVKNHQQNFRLSLIIISKLVQKKE